MKRIHFLDNIRVFAMLTVLAVHALFFYAPTAYINYIMHFKTDFYVIDYIIAALHYINMPIYFVLAGFFAAHMLKNKMIAYFFNERIVKLAIPLVAGLIIFSPLHILMYLFKSSVNPAWHNNLFFHFFSILLNPEYLWFIYYLLLYSLIFAFCSQIRMLKSLFDFLFLKKWSIALILVLLALFISLGNTIAIALPMNIKLIPQPFFVYGLFFSWGYITYENPNIFEFNKKYCWILSGVSLISLMTMYYMHILAIPLDAITLFTLVNFFFGFFYRYLNINNRFLRYLSTTSYWTYLINFPLFCMMALPVFSLAIPLAFKFVLEICCVLLISLGSYELIIKRTFLLQIYQGKYQLQFIDNWLKFKREQNNAAKVSERVQ